MLRRVWHCKSSRGLVALLLITGALHAAPAPHTPAPLLVQGLGNATVPLNGTWQFHLGDDLAWAAPTLDDSGWEPISADKSWGQQNHFGYTGYAWYRRHIEFAAVPGANIDTALAFPRVEDAYEIYWNGRQVGHFGKLPPNPVWYYNYAAPTFRLGKAGSGVMAIRVWKSPYASFESGEVGGLSAPPLAGSSEAIATHKGAADYQWLRNRQYFFALDVLYGVICTLGVLAWLQRRDRKVLLFMAIFSSTPITTLFLVGFRLALPFTWGIGLLQPVLSLSDISLWFLLLYLLDLDGNRFLLRLTRGLAIISLVSTSLDGFAAVLIANAAHARAAQIIDAVLTVIFTLLEAYPLFLVPFAFKKRLDTSRWLVALFALLTEMINVVRIALTQGVRFTHWTIGEKLRAPLFVINGNPFTADTLMSTGLILSIVYAVYRYSVGQSEKQAALEQEFKSAQELQQVLIPETLPSIPGFSVTSAYRPAAQVGGDFFQLISQADGSSLIVLGDVSGKGLKAAMTVSLIVGTLRTLVETFDDPAEILSGLNRRLHGRLQNGFVTCQVLRLDADGRCLMANAGHLSPFLNHQEVSLPGELPLGLLPVVAYENTAFQLAVGDRLMLYTDGLLEARNGAGEMYSFERLQHLIATEPDAREATEAGVAFGQEDDITVVTLTRLATGVESTTSLLAPVLVPTTA